MSDFEFYEEDDIPPFADPKIRVDYEASLGRLLLAHNEVDYYLAKALKRLVERLAPDNSLNFYAVGTFDVRLRNLELFQKTVPKSGVLKIDVSKLRELNKMRNYVAHGHFDQNLFDGSYTLVGNGRGKGEKLKVYSVAQMDKASAALRSIASTLQAHEAFGDFAPDFPMPPGARPLSPKPDRS